MSSYYVRRRGRIAGPFALDALQQLVRRGKLTRFDHLSADQADWTNAGDYEELFPAHDGAAWTGATGGAVTVAAGTTAGPALDTKFYYAQNGATVGPMTVAMLQSLAGNGTIRADDPVWAEGAEIASLARQLPQLASYFTAGGRTPFHDSVVTLSPDNRQRVGSSTTANGVAASALLALFTFLPLMVIEGRALWWWDVLDAPGGTPLAVQSILVLLIGLSGCITIPLMRGLPRSILMTSLGVVALIGWMVLSVQGMSGSAVATVLAVLSLQALLACLYSAARFRLLPSVGSTGAGRVTQLIFGALTGLLSLALLIFSLLEMNLDGMPAMAVLAWILWILSLLSGVGACTVSAVSMMPSFARGRELSIAICSMAALGLIAIAGIMLVVTIGRELMWFQSAATSVILWLVVRFSVLFYAALYLLATGLRELLVSARS